jgi:YVTN family beta-propeller protein
VKELEHRLRQTLKSVGESYLPQEPAAARARFLARRRRRMAARYGGAAVVAGTAAVAVFLVFGTSDVAREADEAPAVPVVGPSIEAVVSDRVDVGDAPSGVGAGGGYIWVANSGDDTVAKLDPATNEVVQTFRVAGRPDDVLATNDNVFVTSGDGTLTRIAIDTGTRSEIAYNDPHLDIARAPNGDILVQESEGGLHLVRDSDAREVSTVGVRASDVSANNKWVWIYDRDAGEVRRLDPNALFVVDSTVVGTSESADLAATDDDSWLYLGSTGELVRIDQTDGDIVSRTQLGGTFGAIAEEAGFLYVMTTDGGTNGSGDGRLYRLDAASGAIIGDPVPLTNFPYDVEAGPDGIWVTNNSGDTLTRIELVTKEGVPADDNPAVAAETLFYFSKGGDIFSYQWDGTTTPVVDSPAYESDPTVAPDGRSFLYERKQDVDSDPSISRYPGNDVVFDGEAGTSPEYGPDGRIAWVRFSEDPPPITIVVDDPAQPDQRLEFEPDPKRGPSPLLPDQIAWDVSGNTIYFIDLYARSRVLYSADVSVDATEPSPIVIAPDEKGALYVSPAVLEDGTLWVVKLCCEGSGSGYTVAELGRLVDGRFEKIVGLDDIVGQGSLANIWFDPAGYLDYETETGWTIGDHRSWLVGQGEGLWLVNDTGEVNVIDLTDVDDVAVVPVAQD